MEKDDQDHQEGHAQRVHLVKVGLVLLVQPREQVCQEGRLLAGWVGVRAQVAIDEVDQVVGGVEQALQEVADAAGASQVAKPEEQGLPPGLPGLTDHLHLPRHEICKSHGEQNKNKPGGVKGRSTSAQPRPPWSPPSEFKFRV